MATKTITAKLTRKAGNGSGFQLEGEDGWFNAGEKSKSYLAKIELGKVVEVSYFQKGAKREVTLIKEATAKAEAPKEEVPKETDKPTCSVCGKELKNPNYPTCWGCKDEAPKANKETEQPKEKKNYYNEDRTAQIQRGNALNAAASVMSNPSLNIPDSSPEGLIQATLLAAERFLEYLREE